MPAPGLPGAGMEAAPRRAPLHGAGPRARARAGWPLGSWHAPPACELPASPEASRTPRSLRCCPGVGPRRLCRASLSASGTGPAPAASPSAAASERPAGGGSGRAGAGGAPGEHAAESREAGSGAPGEARARRQHPRGAAGEDETAASVVSASEVRQENWGGCAGGGGAQLGYPDSAASGFPTPTPTSLPHPQALLAWDTAIRAGRSPGSRGCEGVSDTSICDSEG